MKPETAGPTRSHLRRFGWAFALLLGAVSWRQPPGLTALALRLTAGVLFGVATVWPLTLTLPYRLVEWLTKPVRRTVSYLALGLIYYGLVTPLAFAMRFAGRDALGLEPDRHAESYWRQRPPAPEPRSYYRQF